MGQPPKREIERLKREKREAKAARKRKENTRDIIVRFLIVCEGQKTEPNYFKALIDNHYSEVRDVEAEIRGQGCSTCALVERAKEIRDNLEKERELGFDRIWVVFDKDDFDDFNRAIDLAKSYGFGCAWTNEAFELWFLLHFQYLDVPISRDAYISKLENLIQKRLNDNSFRYNKNDPSFYNILKDHGDGILAKRYAEKLRLKHKDKDYANHNPCTRVDLLVEELENPRSVLKNK